MKALVIFDFDGVIVDTEDIKAKYYCQYLQEHGVLFDEKEIYRLSGLTHEDFINNIDDIFKNSRPYAVCREEMLKKKPEFKYKDILHRHVKEVFTFLHQRHISIAIASNSSYQRLRKALIECGLLAYVDFICSGTDSGHKKPDPYVYIMCRKYFALTKEQCLIVEDSLAGVQAAKNSGIFCVQYRGSENVALSVIADGIITDLLDLIKYV